LCFHDASSFNKKALAAFAAGQENTTRDTAAALCVVSAAAYCVYRFGVYFSTWKAKNASEIFICADGFLQSRPIRKIYRINEKNGHAPANVLRFNSSFYPYLIRFARFGFRTCRAYKTL